MSDEQTTADDPSGPGWAWVAKGDTVREGDMWSDDGVWYTTESIGQPVHYNNQYRRRIEPQQPSDSEPGIAELQQLREQVQDLLQQTELYAVKLERCRERAQLAEHELATETKRYQDSFRDHHKAGQQQLVDRLQAWLRPVLEVVAENPEDAVPLAVALLGYLPRIAGRLIEETVDEAHERR